MKLRAAFRKFWQGCRIEEKVVLVVGTVFLLFCASDYMVTRPEPVPEAPFFQLAPGETS